MKDAVISEASPRTLVLVFDRGEEVIGVLTRYAKRNGLSACHFTGIGGLSEAVVGFFDWEKKDYLRIPIRDQVELLSLAGDIALKDGEPVVHAHAVLGKRDGTAHGGHLLSGKVRPTLELVLVETPGSLARVPDPESGLALIRPGLEKSADPSGASPEAPRRRAGRTSVESMPRRRKAQ